MTARSVFKLFSKTCSYSLQSTCPQSIPSLCSDRCYKRQPRSCSQTRRKHYKSAGEHFLQLRKISKSLVNLRESRYKEEDFEEEDYEKHSYPHNAFPSVADVTYRNTAKEFKNEYAAEEKNEEGAPIYELAECSRSEENFHDVLNFMRKQTDRQAKKLFVHLQPCNLKPFGSNENLHYPQISQKRIKIVYPYISTGSQADIKKKKVETTQYKEFSTQSGTKIVQKEYPGYEDTKKLAVSESKSKDMIKMNYSTFSTKKNIKPKLTVNSSCLTRRSSTMLLKKKKNKKHIEEIIAECSEKLGEYQAKKDKTRSYNTYNKPDSVRSDYITVKLGDLKEECRKEKKCKPKKINFGRLPKLPPPDCPCFEATPMKEGKPLTRLKKRFEIGDRDNTCSTTLTCTTERADANYVIKQKTLPPIEAKECPCVEREMTDFVIRRLPKKTVPEPPRICGCEATYDCCPPRADEKLTVEPKKLPKLEINDCPCIERLPMKDVPLKKLIANPVEEPKKVCPVPDVCDTTIRADEGLKVEKKVLPQIKGDCVCPEPPKMQPGRPLSRLKNIIYEDIPCKPCFPEPCPVRADHDKKVEVKKLPVFVPQSCPCIEKEGPTVSVKLKRLIKKSIKEAKKVCEKVEVCPPRADDGLQVKPKRLPTLEMKDCPCVQRVLEEGPPLKRLAPVDIPEPPKKVCEVKEVCMTERSDDNLKVRPKKLPVLPPGACPCTEPPPQKEGKPLTKLKKKHLSVVRVCEVKRDECPPRADEGLTVKAKKLPKLQINDCPCVEETPPEDVPLTRLRKVVVPEPERRVCPIVDVCEEIPRADEDDWLYWKRVEVKSAAKPEDKRNFSTIARRNYSTSTKMEEDLFKIRYNVPGLPPSRLNDQPYNIIIDIKPSTPLILTQKPVDLNQLDGLDSSFGGTKLRRSKSEPVDCVTFVIYKSNSLGVGSKSLKEGSSDVSLVFNSFNRFISTCSSLYENSKDKKDKLKDHVTPQCECPPNDRYLQPKNPILPEREHFISPFPDDDFIDSAVKKSRKYSSRQRIDEGKEAEQGILRCDGEETKEVCESPNAGDVLEPCVKQEEKKKLTLWERIVNYFKARPNCPTPEEFKKIRLKEQAEKAASKAGLCIYDPKEMLHKNEKELPKVITAGSLKEEEEECSK